MNGLGVFIPIVFLSLAVTGIISAVVIKLQRLRLEEARLRTGTATDDELSRQVGILQQEMVELQERVDFAERMLAQMKDAPALPRGSEPSP